MDDTNMHDCIHPTGSHPCHCGLGREHTVEAGMVNDLDQWSDGYTAGFTDSARPLKDGVWLDEDDASYVASFVREGFSRRARNLVARLTRGK